MRFLSPVPMFLRSPVLLSSLLVCALGSAHPWSQERLYQAPEWSETLRASVEGLTGILYDSIPVNGQRVQVFAYYGTPGGEPPEGGWPAVVCVHGGGGTAFSEWVAKWNRHGYAAISMDLEGHYPIRETEERRSPRIPTENPGLHRLGIFKNYEDPIEQQWYYHAVSQAILAHSLIRSFSEVNAEKVGLTGISWGGTLTSTIMGVDDRFAFAIPVYGCGFLPDSDGNQGLAIKSGKYTEVVNTYFDGSAYFEYVTIPTLWVNGTNDKHFPMPATQASSQAVNGPATLRYELEMRHGHGPGWDPKEIYAFADSIVKGGPAFAVFEKPKMENGQATVSVSAPADLEKARFYYTLDTGLWPERKWRKLPATLAGDRLSAAIPEGAVAFYFDVVDERGLMVSSEFSMVR